MRKEDAFYLGYISKAYSFKGEIILYIDASQPEVYSELESVFVEINDKLVPFLIESLRFDRNGPYARVKLEDVNDEAGSRQLVGKQVYIASDLVAESEKELLRPNDLNGFVVNDSEHGNLGTVTSFIDHAANPVLEVDGDTGKVLIPFNEVFVTNVDLVNRTIEVSIPEGLIGLNN